MKLTSSERQRLKAMAHSLKPIIQIGKNGITEGVINAISKGLQDHELIKVKFLEYKNQKEEISEEISEKTSSHLIEIIGNIAVFFIENPDLNEKKE